ncbi:MAG: hypothetical protein ACR2PI_14685 [Hyphomicrobiaceae bacterium]
MDKTGEQPKSLGDYRVPDDREALIHTHIAMLSETARRVSDQLAFAADVSDLTAELEAGADDDAEGAQ